MRGIQSDDDAEWAAIPLALRIGVAVAIAVAFLATAQLIGPVVGLLSIPAWSLVFVLLAYRYGQRKEPG